jgi:hypothetical protein
LELGADWGFAFGREGRSILELALSLDAGSPATAETSLTAAGGARRDTGASAALAIIAEIRREATYG